MYREKNLNNAALFLINSNKKTRGSSAYYSRIYNPINGWSNPYPETTGYIIPTLISLSKIDGYEFLENNIINISDWLLSIQNQDGSFCGGLYPNNKQNKSIFNTAQIIIGLLAASNYFKDDKFLDAAHNAANWLSDNQEDSGDWIKYQYYKEFSPSYYTRVAWPMLEVAKLTNNNIIKDSAIKSLDNILSKVKKNHFIKDAGFKKNNYAFLHTICYTIRGFLESSLILDRSDYWDTAYDLAYYFLRKYEIDHRLGGAYYEDLKSINWYRCLTGEAQLCIIWLKIFNNNDDIRFVNASSKLLDDICKTQPMHDSLFLKKGGLKGSQPYFGRYIPFRQPNWSTKFFIDAILLENYSYEKIKDKLKL